MNKKLYNRILTAVSVLIIITTIGYGYLNVSNYNLNLQLSEQIVNLMYKANDIDVLYSNADKLETLCEPEIFSILDNREPTNLMRRFSKVEPMTPNIINSSVDDNKVMLLVTFNTGSTLRDRLIVLEFSDNNLLSDYTEYEMVNKFKGE